MSQALSETVPSGLELGDRSISIPPGAGTHMMRAGVGFCIFAIATVLIDACYLEWHGWFPSLWTLIAGAVGWVLLIWPAAMKDRLANSAVRERWCAFTVFAGFLALYAATSLASTPYNEQVRQAFAFLHGHVDIDAPKSFLEAAQVGRYRYALHPPLPALMLMPLVAVWGMATDQTVCSLFIGAMDVMLMWRMLRRFRVSVSARIWLTVFFGAGTVLWSETIYGNTWSMPETVAVLFTLAALDEAFGPARPLLLGLYGGLAALSRYELALAGIAYAVLALNRGRRIRDLFWMVPGFAAVGGFFVWYNEVRYQSFFDQGVSITGPSNGPAFGLRYLVGNLNTIFFMEPRIDDAFPYVHPHFGGQAIVYTSPALVLALRASLAKLEPLLMIVTAFAVSIPSLLCYANGFAQFGTRHYLQAFPFLMVMMAMRMRRPDRLAKILIGASVVFIAYGVWYIHVWGLGA